MAKRVTCDDEKKRKKKKDEKRCVKMSLQLLYTANFFQYDSTSQHLVRGSVC